MKSWRGGRKGDIDPAGKILMRRMKRTNIRTSAPTLDQIGKWLVQHVGQRWFPLRKSKRQVQTQRYPFQAFQESELWYVHPFPQSNGTLLLQIPKREIKESVFKVGTDTWKDLFCKACSDWNGWIIHNCWRNSSIHLEQHSKCSKDLQKNDQRHPQIWSESSILMSCSDLCKTESPWTWGILRSIQTHFPTYGQKRMHFHLDRWSRFQFQSDPTILMGRKSWTNFANLKYETSMLYCDLCIDW